MSLRIYIKGTPKFNSPKKSDSPLPLSPHFNPLPSTKAAHPSKKSSILHTESREASIMSEISPIRSENQLQSTYENNNKSRRLSQFDSRKGSKNSRYMSYQEEEDSQRKSGKNTTKNPQSNPKLQKAIKEFQRRFSNRENIPDRQLRIIIQDCDEIIRNLVQELDKSKKLLTEKEGQNGQLQKDKEILETNFQNMERNVFNKIKEQFERKYMKEFGQRADNDAELLHENIRLEEKMKRLMTSNQELLEEISLLKEKFDKNENIMHKERKSFLNLKSQVEALITLNEELDYKLKEKEKDSKKLEDGLREAMSNAEKLLKEVYGKNQLIEELRKSLVVADFQSPIQNTKTKRLRDEGHNIVSPSGEGGTTNTVTWSTFRMESPREPPMDKTKEEAGEWQKKYETIKSDNSRLVKIIEGNQKIIKDMKESFSELERRNNGRFEDIVNYYEKKLKGLQAEKDMKGFNDTATKLTAGTMNSLYSSHIHSKKGSSESVWKDKSDLPFAMSIYN